MKRRIIAFLLLVTLIASPVISQAFDCNELPKHSQSKADAKTAKAIHVDHHCCHTNTFNAETETHSVNIDFTSSKIAVEQIELISLFEPSPIIKPPAQA